MTWGWELRPRSRRPTPDRPRVDQRVMGREHVFPGAPLACLVVFYSDPSADLFFRGNFPPDSHENPGQLNQLLPPVPQYFLTGRGPGGARGAGAENLEAEPAAWPFPPF